MKPYHLLPKRTKHIQTIGDAMGKNIAWLSHDVSIFYLYFISLYSFIYCVLTFTKIIKFQVCGANWTLCHCIRVKLRVRWRLKEMAGSCCFHVMLKWLVFCFVYGTNVNVFCWNFRINQIFGIEYVITKFFMVVFFLYMINIMQFEEQLWILYWF